MLFDQNDLCLTFKFKMVTVNTQKEAMFMHVSYNIINVIILFNGNLKIRLRYTTDYVTARSCV